MIRCNLDIPVSFEKLQFIALQLNSDKRKEQKFQSSLLSEHLRCTWDLEVKVSVIIDFDRY